MTRQPLKQALANVTEHTEFDPNAVLAHCAGFSQSLAFKKALAISKPPTAPSKAQKVERSASNKNLYVAQADLDWLLHSPELILLDQAAKQHELGIDISPFPYNEQMGNLSENFASGQRRLGLYAEDLMSAYFSSSISPHILIARNLQIASGPQHRTVGEFDFITRDKASHWYQHTELACKFYLGLPNCHTSTATPWNRWIGPNCNDRLDIKLDKLMQRQLTLSLHQASDTRLQELGIHPLKIHYMLRGRLFYPAFANTSMPQHASEAHLKGLWCSQSQLGEFIKKLNIEWPKWQFAQLNSLEFMATKARDCYQHSSLPSWELKSYVDHYFAQQRKQAEDRSEKHPNKTPRPLPLVINRRNTDENPNAPAAELRLFIVDDPWLERAEEFSNAKA